MPRAKYIPTTAATSRLTVVIMLIIASVWLSGALSAQMLTGSSDATDDDEDIRISPKLDVDDAITDFFEDEEVVVPSFVRSIPIAMNGDDWSALRQALTDGAHAVSIVHLGDSHLQADIATNDVRELLQLEFGNAGRGLVSPLKLSGTNQPYNYGFASNIVWEPQKFMKAWTREMGVTGCSLYAAHPEGYIELSTSEKYDYNPFTRITLHHTGEMCIAEVTDDEGQSLGFARQDVAEGTALLLSAPKRQVKIHLTDCGALTLFGAYLSAGRPGVVYNVIGNNGAAYSSYNRINDFGEKLRTLTPRLLIISLGTNEAFGAFNALTFISEVDRLIKNARRANPGIRILLTTPGECERRTYTTVRRTGGKKRRRTTQRRATFTVNQNIVKVRNALMSYASREHIPIYDYYTAAGSCSRWIDSGLFSKDHVHLSGKGYHVQGKMLFEALIQQLK